jgi:diguanylate cyclase (GGDEF)-like protein
MPAGASVPWLSLQRVADTLRAQLPPGAGVAVACNDWMLGLSSAVSGAVPPGRVKELEDVLEDVGGGVGGFPDLESGRIWSSADGSARLGVLLNLGAEADDGGHDAWLQLATILVDASLHAAYAHLRIRKLEKSKQLQQALYEIADLAGADLELGEMLRRVHAVVDSLMYAHNCYIVEYDDEQDTLRFLYFADEQDGSLFELGRTYHRGELPGSLTFALLRHGQPVHGPSSLVARVFAMDQRPENAELTGTDSLDWLGVPFRREDRVCGAIVVQSYDRANCYSGEEQTLLSFVAQHILTALDRKQAHVQLERHVQSRTLELQRANIELQEEIIERRRAEKLQAALYRIAELAINSESLDDFYAEVHAVVDELIYARNFYIALLTPDRQMLEFVYSADEHNRYRPPRPFSNGLTEYVIRKQTALLADRDQIDRLQASGEVHGFGVRARSWLGVPLRIEDEVVGVITVQSYTDEIHFSVADQRLLMYVSHHIGSGLGRQRTQERLRAAHVELEQRVRERTAELAKTNAKLVAQIGERMRAEQRLTHQALHDALTELPNRAHLLDRLKGAIEQARQSREDVPFAVLFLDLDRFKVVNDSIGHAAGDELLMEVARRIVSSMRSGDVVARLGGDEFAILVESADGIDTVMELGRRLLDTVNQPLWVAGRELFPSASLGVAVWNARYGSGEELLRDADAAMYRAKASGRNRCVLFDEEMRDAAMQSLVMEADMRRAIKNRDFEPYYQPIVTMEDGAIIGYEALLRWNHPERGVLAPAAFIALGEDSGLIEQVDWLLYEQVIDRLGDGGTRYVSVNVSPRHFRSGDFAERLLALVAERGADPARLRLEITEVALLDDAPRTLRSLQALREAGIRVLLDDFGTGYSALSYLQRFPISALKIDRSFVLGIGEDADGAAESMGLIRAILALARTLGIDAIAEGVETEAQRAVLLSLGCRHGQGYLFGRPAPWQTMAV